MNDLIIRQIDYDSDTQKKKTTILGQTRKYLDNHVAAVADLLQKSSKMYNVQFDFRLSDQIKH